MSQLCDMLSKMFEWMVVLFVFISFWEEDSRRAIAVFHPLYSMHKLVFGGGY